MNDTTELPDFRASHPAIWSNMDSFGNLKVVSDDEVTSMPQNHGWSQAEIDWLDARISHYNTALATTFTRRFVASDPLEHNADIGIADGTIFIPLHPLFKPQILRTYIDWMLLHEPMHETQRRLFGINEASIQSFLNSDGDITTLVRGAPDPSARYSIPPLQSLRSVLPSSILARGVRIALDLHADARMFREGHKVMPRLSAEQIRSGLTPESVLLVQCQVQCACEMGRILSAVERGIRGVIDHVPLLARFAACIHIAKNLFGSLAQSKQNAALEHCLSEGVRLAAEPETASAGTWIVSSMNIAHESSAPFSTLLSREYERTVLSFLDSKDLQTRYQAVVAHYIDLLLIITNRKEHLPNLTVLADAINDEQDADMRLRAIDYLSEIASAEALGMLTKRISIEPDQTVLMDIVRSLSKFGPNYPTQVFRTLKDLTEKAMVNDDVELTCLIAEATQRTLAAWSMKTLGPNPRNRHSILAQAESLTQHVLATSTSMGDASVSAVRSILGSLPYLYDRPLTSAHLIWIAKDHPSLVSEVTLAYAGMIENAYDDASLMLDKEAARSRWHFQDFDVGFASEDFVGLFVRTIDHFETLAQSDHLADRKAFLSGWNAIANAINGCGLFIKEHCFRQLHAFTLGEDDTERLRGVVRLYVAIFRPWPIECANDDHLALISPKDNDSDHQSVVHKASLQELSCIIDDLSDLFESGPSATKVIVAEEIGRAIEEQYRWKPSAHEEIGTYVAILYAFLERHRNSTDTDVRTAIAEASTRISPLVSVEFIDPNPSIHRYLTDPIPEVRQSTIDAIESTLFAHREFAPISPSTHEINAFTSLVDEPLGELALTDEIVAELSRIAGRWDSEVEEELDIERYLPTLFEPESERAEKLDVLERVLSLRYKSPLEEKRALVMALVTYILSEPSTELVDKAIELIFAEFVIREIPIEEGYPELDIHDDGSVSSPMYIHADSSEEITDILDACRRLIEQGNDHVKQQTLATLGTIFGHTDFITTSGGQACSFMVVDFMKTFLSDPNPAIRRGLGTGAVAIHNTTGFSENGTRGLICSLLKDPDPSVHLSIAEEIHRTIQDAGETSSLSRGILVDICAPALADADLPKSIRESLGHLSVDDAVEESWARFEGFLDDPDLSFNEKLKALQSDPIDELDLALKSEEDGAQTLALDYIRRERTVELAEPIINLIEESSSIAIQRLAIQTLGFLRSPSAIQYLISSLRSTDRLIQMRAAKGLARLRAAEGVDALITLAEDSEYASVVAASIEAISKIYTKKHASMFPADLLEFFSEFESSPSPLLVKKTKEAVERVSAKKVPKRRRRKRIRSSEKKPRPTFENEDIDFENDIPF